jgi:hypothetical protein
MESLTQRFNVRRVIATRLCGARCGCFYCKSIFAPSKIVEWVDDDDTALCPFCGIDSVIGSASTFPITAEFLNRMKAY